MSFCQSPISTLPLSCCHSPAQSFHFFLSAIPSLYLPPSPCHSPIVSICHCLPLSLIRCYFLYVPLFLPVSICHSPSTLSDTISLLFSPLSLLLSLVVVWALFVSVLCLPFWNLPPFSVSLSFPAPLSVCLSLCFYICVSVCLSLSLRSLFSLLLYFISSLSTILTMRCSRLGAQSSCASSCPMRSSASFEYFPISSNQII